MATLLHLDSSLHPGSDSRSRTVALSFRDAWREQHPDGTVLYRDLAADPLPHLDVHGFSAAFVDAPSRTPEQEAAFAGRLTLIEELERADAVLLGAPMYNFTIPSTLKSWIDHVLMVGRTTGDTSSVKGVPVTVIASRGGSYAPGTPRESSEYVQNYLRAILGEYMGLELDFIVPELTAAASNPAMAELVPLAEASWARALEDATTKGKEVAQRVRAA
ncbi:MULTISPECIES: FMN-dependent NADH-azoreductase [Streptomycetaceae]|uniref:FMN-dependent NADH-azoreductase n=1 Tax=Streptomycetaceae TaxID=2062 RepID=UPI00035CC9A5|nr:MULTISPECIES: NAD(P)H-dependent oxidoreductase [Streptomycetaceae]MDX2847119.1 NAD(P)H-dependent oxidoreductase [Streptomyces sp. PA03-3a]MYX36910.1 FMN-dependent NADH-azoreductase [Streptomyces sp. SID8377]